MDRAEQWRVFTTVASLRSFSRAARSLGRSPQAVTRAVAALEQRLGTRLLNRTTRSVSLSSDGERYLERSTRAISELDALEAHDETSELQGTLAVTAPVLFGQLEVLPVVEALLAAHPAIAVRLTLLDRVVSLAEEGIDVGVRIGGLPDSSLLARNVGSVRTVVCASPAYLRRTGVPRSPDALIDRACIAFTGTTPLLDRWTFARPGGRNHSVRVTPRLTVNTAQAAIDAATRGLGFARVLSYQVDRLVADKQLEIVLARFEPAPSPVHLVYPPGAQPRIASAFIELAAERLRARLMRR